MYYFFNSSSLRCHFKWLDRDKKVPSVVSHLSWRILNNQIWITSMGFKRVIPIQKKTWKWFVVDSYFEEKYFLCTNCRLIFEITGFYFRISRNMSLRRHPTINSHHRDESSATGWRMNSWKIIIYQMLLYRKSVHRSKWMKTNKYEESHPILPKISRKIISGFLGDFNPSVQSCYIFVSERFHAIFHNEVILPQFS